MKILFIEDEDTAVIGLRSILLSKGHEVDVARVADNAVELLRRYDYDLILLDIMIDTGKTLNGIARREGGKELLLLLRSSRIEGMKTKATVPVVAITAVADLQINKALQSASSVKVLQKPTDPEDAFAKIQAWFEELPEKGEGKFF